MDEQLERIFARLRQNVTFAETDFSDVNGCSILGDNGLHCVVGWGDLSAAKVLIDAGVEINKAGDRGFTPLHVACMKGNLEMVKLLIDHGADMFALSEGDAPFTTARLGEHGPGMRFFGSSYGTKAVAGPKDLGPRKNRPAAT